MKWEERKGSSHDLFKALSWNLAGGTQENNKNYPFKIVQSLEQNANSGPTEHKAGVLIAWL
jgi:hypothetical protein